MSRASILWSGAILAAVYGAYAVAQPQVQPPPPAGGGPANYTVSAAGDSAVLLETRSGRTWLLMRSSDRVQPAVWAPIQRLDDREQVAEWDAAQRERARVMQHNAPLQHRLAELQAILAERRARAVDPQNPVLKQLEAEIAEIEARLKAPAPPPGTT